MPKRNGFCEFMEARRKAVLADGVILTRGRAQLAEILNDEWQNMPESEKGRYKARAEEYNKRMAQTRPAEVNDPNPANPTPQMIKAQIEKREKEFEALRLENRKVVEKLVKTVDTHRHAIVICCFTEYFETTAIEDSYPAEIGLTALSIQDGIMDNFARIIDPGEVPKGRGTDAAGKAHAMRIAYPGTTPHFTDLKAVMQIVQVFLDRYCQHVDDGELQVFAFDADFVSVQKCFAWLCKITEKTLPIRVLSLGYYIHLVSTVSYPQFRLPPVLTDNDRLVACATTTRFNRKAEEVALAGTCTSDPSKTPKTSKHRRFGKSLNSCFVYSDNHPMSRYGIFLSETGVEDCVREMENYKYYEELGCIYHIKKTIGIPHCAMNASNRYAFGILEILTVRNEVKVVVGRHYPEVDNPEKEKGRRLVMFSRWGLTKFEEAMKDENTSEEEDDNLRQPERAPEEVRPAEPGLMRPEPAELRLKLRMQEASVVPTGRGRGRRLQREIPPPGRGPNMNHEFLPRTDGNMQQTPVQFVSPLDMDPFEDYNPEYFTAPISSYL